MQLILIFFLNFVYIFIRGMQIRKTIPSGKNWITPTVDCFIATSLYQGMALSSFALVISEINKTNSYTSLAVAVIGSALGAVAEMKFNGNK